MPSPQSILTKLRPAKVVPYLRRIVRWYLAPSGLLLAAALGLMLFASLGYGPSRVFAFAGVALLAIFLPYRFSRQQGLALDRASAIEAQSLRAQREIADTTSALAETQSQSHAALSREVSDVRDVGRVRGERIDRELEILQTRASLIEECVDEMADRGMKATDTVVALDDRLSVLADGQQELSERVASALSASQRNAVEIESVVDEASKSADKSTMPDSLVAAAVAAVRSEMALWAASTTNQHFDGVALVVSPERCGTTWAFDVLRSLPGASQVATSFIYRTLGIGGNRYPKDLVDRQPHGEPIELRPGIGALLPRLRQPTFDQADGGLLAVEKLHPSAFDFEPTALLGSLGELERTIGRVQVVLLIRDPVDAYRSFVSYQKSGWHLDVSGDSVAQLFASSLSTMQRLRRLHDGCLVVSYEDLMSDPVAGYANIADRLGLKTDRLAVSRVLDAAEEWRALTASSPYYSDSKSEPRAAQLVVGSGLLSEPERDALETARITYEELWIDRIS